MHHALRFTALVHPAAAAILLFQNPVPIPQGNTGTPGVNPGLAGGNQPAPGAKPASAPALPPPLTPEQIQERLANQITGLEARVQALRKLGNITTTAQVPANVAAGGAKPTVDWLRTIVGDIAREVTRRAQAIEVPHAASEAESLLRSREMPTKGFKPAPEAKMIPGAIAAPAPALLPAFDPEKAKEVVYKVGEATITRGHLHSMIDAVRPYMPEATVDQVAEAVIRRSLIRSAVVQSSYATQVAAAAKKSLELRDQVASGKLSIEDAAKQFSDEPMGKALGGLVDGAVAGFVTDFEHMAMTGMKPGDVSQPFLTALTVEFLKLERIEAGATPLQSKFYYRRVMTSIDLGIPAAEQFQMLTKLVNGARVEVLEPAYEPFLPPNIQRVVVKKAGGK